jgi:hypothetical protein
MRAMTRTKSSKGVARPGGTIGWRLGCMIPGCPLVDLQAEGVIVSSILPAQWGSLKSVTNTDQPFNIPG